MLHSGVALWPAFSLTVDLHDLPPVLAGGAVLMAVQVFLSRKEKRRLGLVLPGLWFLGTLADLIPQAVRSRGAGLAAALLLENIPTLLLLLVWAVCRLLRGRKLRRQLRKTQIDDL